MIYFSRARKDVLIAQLAEQALITPKEAEDELIAEEFDYFAALANVRHSRKVPHDAHVVLYRKIAAMRDAHRHQARADVITATTKLRQTLRNMAYYAPHYYDLPQDISESCLSVCAENARVWYAALDRSSIALEAVDL